MAPDGVRVVSALHTVSAAALRRPRPRARRGRAGLRRPSRGQGARQAADRPHRRPALRRRRAPGDGAHRRVADRAADLDQRAQQDARRASRSPASDRPWSSSSPAAPAAPSSPAGCSTWSATSSWSSPTPATTSRSTAPTSPPTPTSCAFWLADRIDERGWGLHGDTFNVMDELRELGVDVWFNLGDRDLAIGLRARSAWPRARTLTEAHRRADRGARASRARVLPMATSRSARGCCARGRWARLPGVHDPRARRGAGRRRRVRGHRGRARARGGRSRRSRARRAIVIGPSNPVISIAPDPRGARACADALRAAAAPVVAVSPDRRRRRCSRARPPPSWRWAGQPLSADGIAGVYDGLLDGIVADERVDARCRRCETDTRMDDADGRAGAWRTTSLALRGGVCSDADRARSCPIKRFDDAKQRLDTTLSAGTPRRWPRRWSPTCWSRCAAPSASTRSSSSPARTAPRRSPAAYDAESSHDDDRGPLRTPRAPGSTGARARLERVLLVPGDCPALDPPSSTSCSAGATSAPDVVIVPDRHGTGTNALLLTPPDAIAPSFGPGSRERHEQRRPGRRRALRGGRGRARWCSTSTPPRTSPRCATRWPRARRRRAHARAARRASTGDELACSRGRCPACPRCARATTSPRCCAARGADCARRRARDRPQGRLQGRGRAARARRRDDLATARRELAARARQGPAPRPGRPRRVRRDRARRSAAC